MRDVCAGLLGLWDGLLFFLLGGGIDFCVMGWVVGESGGRCGEESEKVVCADFVQVARRAGDQLMD